MNLDQIDRLLVDALPWLSMTVFAALLILAAVFATEAYRLGDEDVHDVSDYAPAPPVAPAVQRRLRPAPEPTCTPIHDEVAALPMSDETARAVARRWLRDIAAVEQAKAGIRTAYDPDRDMTGAFPWVRAA